MHLKSLFSSLTLSICLSLFLWGCQNPQKSSTTNLFSWIPPETFGVMEVRQPEVFTPENIGPQWKLLAPILQKSTAQIQALVPEGISSGALLSVSPLGKDDFAWTYLAQIQDSIAPIEPYKTYEGVPIEKHTDTSYTWFRAIVNSIEVRSTSELRLENCIRLQQQGEENPLRSELMALKKASQPKAPAVWYYRASDFWIQQLQWKKPQLLPHSSAQWAMFDGRIENQTIALDGISSTYDSVPSIYTLLENLEAQPLKSLSLLPQDFDELLIIPSENGPLLSQNFQKYTLGKNLSLTDAQIQEFNAFDELSFIQAKGEQALLLHRNGSENTTLPFRWEEEGQFRKFKLGYVVLTPALETFLKAWGIDKRLQVGTYENDFVFLASSESFLKKLLTDQLNGRTLKQSKTFNSYLEKLSNRSSYLWVGNTSVLSQNQASQTTFDDYPFVGLQALIDNNLIHLHSSFAQKGTRENSEGLRNIGTLELDAPLAGPIQWVKNHKTQADDLVVYDQNNQLYLSSNSGKIFWKKKLSAGVVGPISQVDLYKNKRLQLAFRTENKFVILDRNGKVVPPFDIKIPSPEPIQPLAVFDYDKNREYRFLLAQGKDLRMYDRRGKIVRGFKAKKTDAPLLGPPQHFRINKKDYIVFAQSNNQLKVLNRQGSDRIRVKEKINFSQNGIFNYLNTFATTDLDGNLIQVDRKGNTIKTPLQLGADHRVDMTAKSLVSFSGNILTIKGIPVTLPYGSYTAPEVFYLNNTLYITLTDAETQKLYCFYSNATSVQGFPAYGNGAAKLRYNTSNKTIEVAVPGEGNSVLFYDFSVQP